MQALLESRILAGIAYANVSRVRTTSTALTVDSLRSASYRPRYPAMRTQASSHSKSWNGRRSLGVAAALAMVTGCAHGLVRPTDVPVFPPPTPPHSTLVLVLDAAPPPMADELRTSTAGFRDVREADTPADGRLAVLCDAPQALVLRFHLGRVHFDTDNGDRMALLIYQSSRVILLPLAVANAWRWKWYGHTTAEAIADRVRCGTDAEATQIAASVRILSEGRRLVRGRMIESAQSDVAIRAVTRKLLSIALGPEKSAVGTIVVREFSTDGASIDYPDLPPFGLEFAEALAAEIQHLGYAAEAVPLTATVPAGGTVVTGRITVIDRGSRTKRLLFRFGPGSAKFAIAGEISAPDGRQIGAFDHTEQMSKGVFGGGSGILVERGLHQAAAAIAPSIVAGRHEE